MATEPVGRVRLGFAGLHRVSVRCDSLRAPKVCCGHRACGSSAARSWWLRLGAQSEGGVGGLDGALQECGATFHSPGAKRNAHALHLQRERACATCV